MHYLFIYLIVKYVLGFILKLHQTSFDRKQIDNSGINININKTCVKYDDLKQKNWNES